MHRIVPAGAKRVFCSRTTPLHALLSHMRSNIGKTPFGNCLAGGVAGRAAAELRLWTRRPQSTEEVLVRLSQRQGADLPKDIRFLLADTRCAFEAGRDAPLRELDACFLG